MLSCIYTLRHLFMKKCGFILIGLAAALLPSCILTAESKILYNPSSASSGSVRKAMDRNADPYNLESIDIPNQPHLISYVDKRGDSRINPGPRLYAIADTKVGEILIFEGITSKPSPKMLAYEKSLRKDLALQNISTR